MRVRALVAASLLALLSWHLSPATALTPPRPQASYSAPVASSGPTAESGRAALVAAIRAAKAQQDADLAAFYTNLAAQNAHRLVTSTAKFRGSASAPTTDYSSMEPCGGSLPPCWVKNRESKGNYGAFNPTGCYAVVNGVSGRGCYGAWQFGWFWAGKLGLPDDLSTATPAQQDAAAEELWAGGRGCSNWGAC